VIVNGVDNTPLSSFIIEESSTATPIKSEATGGAEEKTFIMDKV